MGLWPRESLQLMHACEFGMEAILNWANDKENSSKNEQARSSIDHTFGTDRLMSGEEDGLRDDFLDDVVPFVILLLSLVGRYAMRALGSLSFERLLGGDGASPTLASRRPASAYVSAQSRSTSRFRPDRRDP